MAVEAILDRMVRKVTSAEVLLDQKPDIKENKGPRGFYSKLCVYSPEPTGY